ncbi:MAG: response regulator transcription factor [Actinobacteria bacterium]|nr:response regulator transcription factor [Actinomycetota bacterium]
MSGRVLVVDDDPGIVDVVTYALRREGFNAEARSDGESALAALRSEPYDVLILDLMLPGLSGLDVCRRLRAESRIPILMLTAKDAELDRVLGLELGADDYVSKPFSVAELVSRVRAILRRREFDREESGGSVRHVGGVKLDLARHQVTADGEPVQLTPSEFKLLSLLAQQPERVFTRRQIMEYLWESPYVGDQHACEVHISNLRRKVEKDPARPERILTVRGIGYKLVAA